MHLLRYQGHCRNARVIVLVVGRMSRNLVYFKVSVNLLVIFAVSEEFYYNSGKDKLLEREFDNLYSKS